jgi:hypothetical protein
MLTSVTLVSFKVVVQNNVEYHIYKIQVKMGNQKLLHVPLINEKNHTPQDIGV